MNRSLLVLEFSFALFTPLALGQPNTIFILAHPLRHHDRPLQLALMAEKHRDLVARQTGADDHAQPTHRARIPEKKPATTPPWSASGASA